MSGIFLGRTLSRAVRSFSVQRFWADPLALLPLSLPVGRRARVRGDWRRCPFRTTALPPFACRHTARLRRAVQVCRSYAALRLREPDRPRFLISRNAKGFALSFPKAE